MATDGTTNTQNSGTNHHRQKRMGPAPFASFEDLSDELESPEEKAGSVVRLPGIREDITPSTPNMSHQEPVYSGISLIGQIKTPLNPSTSFADSVPSASKLQAPHAPRIDISRASSSSHHDSKDSSPDRDIIEGKFENTRDQGTAKLGVGFREDGTLDLRSSTEELDFQEQGEERRKSCSRSRPQSPSHFVQDDPYQNHSRKDSQCSEIGLLSISGRTSRLSSIGSVGSAQSRLSNASHLSALSGATELSRSPSPHKMLLETSFCGTKSPQQSSLAIDKIGTKIDSDDLEKILLSRKHDPTEAILAEGVHVRKETRPSSMRVTPEKPARKIEKRNQSMKSEITIKVDTPSSQNDDGNLTPRPTKKIVSESGVEYIYIPLKGPLPLDFQENESTLPSSKSVPRKSATTTANAKTKPGSAPPKLKSSKPEPASTDSKTSSKVREITSAPPPIIVHQRNKDEPKYIRIKLKPDHLYDDDNASYNTSEKYDLDEIKTDESTTTGKSLTSTPSLSPKFSRHPVNVDNSKTPSPSLSRKSSFASIFRSKEAILTSTSPESPTVPSKRKNTITGILKEATESLKERRRSRSRSKSREREKPSSNIPSSTESINSGTSTKMDKTKGSGSVLTIFKGDSNKKSRSNSPEIQKIEIKTKPTTFERPLDAASVRIPLHSPEYYERQRNFNFKDIQTPSQDSQDTVIEVVPPKKEETTTSSQIEVNVIHQEADVTASKIESQTTSISKKESQSRQSSSSSENLIFTTNVGNNNEFFSTKLPKERGLTHSENILVSNGHIPTTKMQEAPISEAAISPSATSTTSLKTEEIKLGINKPLAPEDEKNNNNDSSESEKDSEASSVQSSAKTSIKAELEPESKSLVQIQDSFEDELPYVPTTLPLERSSAVPIIPIKQRSTFEMKTYPIDRPRSTTPINPSSLDDYCEDMMMKMNAETSKLKISLPRSDSAKSPKKPNQSTTSWFDFDKGIQTGRKLSSESGGGCETPPPLPPKKVAVLPQKEWINFEEVPERRKLPKRIQTIPSRGHIEVPESVLQHQQDHVVYNYVNPDECKCECHEKKENKMVKDEINQQQDDEVPLLLENEQDEEKVPDRIQRLEAAITDRTSYISDSSADLSNVEAIQADNSLQTPFKTDLDVSSNRSSIASQDDINSPYTDKPNAFFKTS